MFDLEPGGAGECPLNLPKGYELIQVSVEGLAVTPRAVDPQSWRFPLASRQLPERVEVLFRRRLSATDQTNRQNFEAPVLGSLPVRQTLWTVIGQSSRPLSDPEGVPTVSAWKQELARLRSAAAAFQSACTVQSDDPDETLRSYQLWNQRLKAARTAVERELTAAGAGPETAGGQREANAIEKQRGELVKRVEAAGALARPAAVPVTQNSGESFRRAWATGSASAGATGSASASATGSAGASATGSAGASATGSASAGATGSAGASATGSASAGATGSASATEPVVRCAFEGRADSLMLDSRSAETSGLFYRLIAAAVLALLACLAAAGTIPGRLIATLRRWPHASGAALGVAWWLWLWPGVVGLGIVLGCVLAVGRARIIAKK